MRETSSVEGTGQQIGLFLTASVRGPLGSRWNSEILATRPWQHVLEPLGGYLTASAISENPELQGEPFNFGPPARQAHSVLELVKQMSIHWDQVRWEDVSGMKAFPMNRNC